MADPQKTVLVVDDDERILSLLQETLTVAGYRALTAASGPETMRKLTAEHVDAVITDIKMPEWDGLTLLERIKSEWPQLPVIMVTAYSNEEVKAKAARGGADGFLGKPFRIDRLEEMIKDALRRASIKAGDTNQKIRSVLIVEDDEEFRQVLMEIFPALGYKPKEAPDGETALEMLAKGEFDAVVADYMLPKMTGVELMTQIKEQYPGMPVVIITGYAPSLDGHDFADADGYLMKPFRFDEIDKLLKNLPATK